MKLSLNNLALIDELTREGKTGQEIAKTLNVSPGRISQVKKTLNMNKASVLQIEKAGEIVNNHIDAAQELFELHQEAKSLLEMMKKKVTGDIVGLPKGFGEHGKKDPIELYQKIMQESRAQLSLYLDFSKTMYDIKVMATFQQSVLDAINEVAPEVKDRIVQKLKEARAIRPNLQL